MMKKSEGDESFNKNSGINKGTFAMGHKKKDGKSGRTLHQQAYDKLQKMQAFGDSKRLDKLENPEEFARKIYSFSTYQTYFKH